MFGRIRGISTFILITLSFVSCNVIEIEPDIDAEFDPSIGAVLPLTYYSYIQTFSNQNQSFNNKYHAGEDAMGYGGIPVYAVMDGVVSFSGAMPGYGWLVIIDHPDENVYSLYGHISRSRNKISVDSVVSCGDLIGFLADDDEDGSGETFEGFTYPYWAPHLHFGIREGKKSDYPNTGDTRWEAGYTEVLPQTIGWYNPSAYILSKLNEFQD
ncbi:M23 family metallopeptidase [Bacteroidota bacterium]